MDQKNPFESPVTFRLHRAEYVVGFALSIVLILTHLGEIRWLPFLALFFVTDVVGYFPGAIAFRRSPDGRIHRAYYVLYNVMHSLITQAAIAGLWMWTIGPEWALLAIPFHVLGDRGVFGNFLKPFGLPFEPVRLPLYDRIVAVLRDEPQGVPALRMPVPARVEREPVAPAGRR
jgi:hypothetical protein